MDTVFGEASKGDTVDVLTGDAGVDFLVGDDVRKGSRVLVLEASVVQLQVKGFNGMLLRIGGTGADGFIVKEVVGARGAVTRTRLNNT